MNAPQLMIAPAAQSRSSRTPELTPDELKALKPHVITLTDGRLDREATPDPKTANGFATTEADIDAIFTKHLPEFMKDKKLATVQIVLYAHGGLVDVEAGFATAHKQVHWWTENGVYPIHFVWKTGAWTAIWDAIGRWVTGGSRGFFDDAKDLIIEDGARVLGGEQVWLDMKLDAAAFSDPSGPAKTFATKLAEWMDADPDRTKLHLVGHSAGSIFHTHLIPVIFAAEIPRIETVTFLAPAVRIDTFRSRLLPHAPRIGNLAIFTMNQKAELNDTCFAAYGRSLLYLVTASFEPNRGTPILGLAKDIERDAEVKALLGGPGGEIILTPNKMKGSSASTADTHGGFDDDGPTMESVLLRVTGLEQVKVPFPAEARAIDPWADIVVPDAPRGNNGKTALCVGIDEYPRPADRLKGAVNDSDLWREVLLKAGFAVTSLTNTDATRANILGSLYQMISSASPGDVLVLQYAGHGTRAPDLNGGDEDDQRDEAICPVDFRDGQLILDDDLAKLWDLIPDGVTFTVFLDSCHSGDGNRDVTPGDESLPRGVELTARDDHEFRVARGVAAAKGRKSALELVESSEPDTTEDKQRQAVVQREVLFAACSSKQLAWETSGQGDFTRSVVPLIDGNVGKVSNRAFFETILANFDAHRQDPTFTTTPRFAEAPLLAATYDGASGDRITDIQEPDRSAPTTVTSRDAAIADILRGVADLLES